MNVGIAAPLFDLDGSMLLPILADSQFMDLSQRVSVSNILSGGSVIKTRGYFDTNRAIKVSVNLDKENEDKLLYIFKNYPYLYFSTPDGFFLAVISGLVKTENTIALTVLIKEKLS